MKTTTESEEGSAKSPIVLDNVTTVMGEEVEEGPAPYVMDKTPLQKVPESAQGMMRSALGHEQVFRPKTYGKDKNTDKYYEYVADGAIKSSLKTMGYRCG